MKNGHRNMKKTQYRQIYEKDTEKHERYRHINMKIYREKSKTTHKKTENNVRRDREPYKNDKVKRHRNMKDKLKNDKINGHTNYKVQRQRIIPRHYVEFNQDIDKDMSRGTYKKN